LVATGLALLCVATGGCARAEELSGADDLLDVYIKVCSEEVRFVAQELDRTNSFFFRQVVDAPAGSPLWPLVKAAWDAGPRVRLLYHGLEKTPQKYNAWADAKGLSAWFNVPNAAAQVHRWEAVRPLLVPVLAESRALGWQTPDQDADVWRQSDQAPLFEWMLLLRWLGGPPADQPRSDLAWVRTESGADLVPQWAQREADPHPMLHGEYVYATLDSPPAARLAARAANALRRCSWDAQGRSGTFADFVAHKDRALLALLDLLAEDPTNTAAAAWFACGARFFPPFTALQPEPGPDPESPRVFTLRPPPSLPARVAAFTDACGQPGLARTVQNAILWYPLEALHADGTWRAPARGWSQFVPDPGVGRNPADPTASSLAAPPGKELGASQDVGAAPTLAEWGPSSPDEAWHRVCRLWVAPHVRTNTATNWVLAVRNSTGWALAFGEEELAEVLRQNNPAGQFRPAGRVHGPSAMLGEVVVRGVKAEESVTLQWRVNGKVRDERTVLIRGQWPGWFAAAPWSWRQTWLGLVACVGLGGALSWRLWRLWRRLHWVGSGTPRSGFHLDLWSSAAQVVYLAALVLCGVAVVVHCVWRRPVARPCAELGGVVEFAVPAHAGLPKGLRRCVVQSCLAVYRMLGEKVDPREAARNPIGFWPRFLETCRRVWTLQRGDSFSAGGGGTLVNLEYQVTPVAWPAPDPIRGRVRPSEQADFERTLQDLEARGEVDVPPPLAVGPEPGRTLVLTVTDGDHGGLKPPGPFRLPCRTNVLTVFLGFATRDGHPARGLGAGARRQWVTARSDRVLESPQPRLADAVLDGCTNQPSDLAAWNVQAWSQVDEASLQPFGDTVQQAAAQLIQAQSRQASRTELRAEALPWFWLFAGPIAGLVLLMHHLGAHPGRWLWKAAGMAAWSLGAYLCLGVVVALFCCLNDRWLRSYGDPLVDGGCASAGLFLRVLVGVSLLVLLLTLMSSRTQESADGIFPPEPSPTPARAVRLLCEWGALCSLGLAGTILAAAPIRAVSACAWWLPGSYDSSRLWSLALWLGGVWLLAAAFALKNQAEVSRGRA
jgi:hypothetical protein